MIVELFEPPMCCPTGICGPSVDQKLVKVMEDIETLKKKYPGLEVERYSISIQPQKFKEREEIYRLVTKNGKKILPVTVVNGKIMKERENATLEEIELHLSND
ncbi:arsenical resistance operon trans-acting repressor ArsD [Gottschalkia purinilytica]|uniref:Arsenical resistance operon trans-acting repressor ArsD n=1 Tax=Gottschalkia purinilytica TaxID=1503 RepID=A0A0L0W6X1_GOTPU|nr:arsenite efflux transporter metallochaperone ArsD [Gottschalkia purinilytica]KNF07308.1 arsenical resistance operon trans-acting repressor ArsD [Gottschalkia purinilytica]